MGSYTNANTGTYTLSNVNTGGSVSTGTVNFNSNNVYWGIDNSYDRPFNTIEKNNKKIMQYELIGLNKSHITVKKNFVNKTKTLFVTVEGKYEDEITGWKNEINIKLDVNYEVYNRVSWNVKDGILNIILHEIVNEEPDVQLIDENAYGLQK